MYPYSLVAKTSSLDVEIVIVHDAKVKVILLLIGHEFFLIGFVHILDGKFHGAVGTFFRFRQRVVNLYSHPDQSSSGSFQLW